MHISLYISAMNFTFHFIIIQLSADVSRQLPICHLFFFIGLNDLMLVNMCRFPVRNSPFTYHVYEFLRHPTPVHVVLCCDNLPFIPVLPSLSSYIRCFLQ